MKKDKSLKDFKKKLEECEKVNNEYLSSWKRERADFLNFKKAEIERVAEAIRYVESGIILKLLLVLDNFDFAEKSMPEDLKKEENVKGLLQIRSQIRDILKTREVEGIECLGKEFDPYLHESVEEVEKNPKNKNIKSGTVVEEIQKGYRIGDKVLRPSRVKIIK